MGSEEKKQGLARRLVQELAQKGEGVGVHVRVPESYIVKQDGCGWITPAVDAPPHLWEHTLLIDFSLLSSRSSLARHNELAKLHSALKQWGCFQVINHNMSNSFLDEFLQVSKQFFALPLEERWQYLVNDDANGYANTNENTRDMTLNWSDRLTLIVYPEDQRKLEFWPKKPCRFRDILEEHTLKIRMMVEVLLKSMAQLMNLKDDRFLNLHGERGSIATKIRIYPRCSVPDQVYGVSPHADRSTLTIILQDKDVPEGLEIHKDGQWFKAPVIPGALFVNAGDFAEVNSNGMFKSPLHRVMTNSVKDRVSISTFCSPDPEIELEPLPELISSHHPRMYKTVTMNTYSKLFLESFKTLDKRTVDALKI